MHGTSLFMSVHFPVNLELFQNGKLKKHTTFFFYKLAIIDATRTDFNVVCVFFTFLFMQKEGQVTSGAITFYFLKKKTKQKTRTRSKYDKMLTL